MDSANIALLSIIRNTSEGAVANANAQHEKTDQIAVAMAEMSQTSMEISRNMQETASETNSVRAQGESGRSLMLEAKKSIEILDRQIDGTSEIVGRLAEDTQAIASILEAIEAIAEQTNLLALNAAIEAARAGEQGRGFAVVADEVRVLAKRTQKSTEEIQSIIARLSASSTEAVDYMSESKKVTEKTVGMVLKNQEKFESLFLSIETISGLITQVATAAEEQTQVSDEINENIQSVSTLSDQTLSDTRAAAKAIDSMAIAFGQTKSRITEFNV